MQLDEIDQDKQIMLTLRFGGRETFCWADLKVDGLKVFALPTTPHQEMQPYRPASIELDPRRILPTQYPPPTGRTFYAYSGPVEIESND
jgi:hypothetical protein